MTTKLTIPRKQSNSGSIYDLASDQFDRVIEFGNFEYAVVLPAYYNTSPTRHKSADSVEERLVKLSEFSGVRIFNCQGQECDFDSYEWTGKVKVLCDADANGFAFEEIAETRTEKINRLQKRHPKTRRQRNSHGSGRFTVDFFSKDSGERVASYEV